MVLRAGSRLEGIAADYLLPQTVFRRAWLAAGRGNSAALIVQLRSGRSSDCSIRPSLRHLIDGTVQPAGAQVQFAAGALQDLALQRVAVAFTLTERQRHVEDGRRQQAHKPFYD
jgi:hypothetical protein